VTLPATQNLTYFGLIGLSSLLVLRAVRVVNRVALAPILQLRCRARSDLVPGDIVVIAGDLNGTASDYISLYVIV
jgi:hypothetical protein